MLIYKATNKQNGKIYIGLTRKTIADRLRTHLCSGHLFTAALKQFGKDQFEIIEIDRAETVGALAQKEKYWIDFYNCRHPNGYNIAPGGHFGPNIGIKYRPLTEEDKRKKSIAGMGKNKGRKRPDLAERNRQARLSPNYKNTMLGKKRPDLAARNSSPEYRAYMSEKMKGVNLGRKKPPRTPEHCAKISAALQARRALKNKSNEGPPQMFHKTRTKAAIAKRRSA
jgi:group I intron endonuclease